MFSELGLIALLFTTCVLMADFVYCCMGMSHVAISCDAKKFYAYAFYALFFAVMVLVLSFVTNDFGVRYVYQNSSLNLPFWYKMTAFWSSHDGSWLLWFTLSLWNAYSLRRQIDASGLSCFNYIPLTIMLFCYAVYQVLTSNPFIRILPIAPGNGLDMNPLLQDLIFTIHPPCLYMGLCAMIVPFSIACNFDVDRADVLKPILKSWLYWSWGWLTLGITLGSLWAYKELGWGGWWFWDPVENAAFMPWLLITVLLHLVSDHSRFDMPSLRFYCIAAFLFTLLGTWITRSGAFVSVHGFATSGHRGYVLFLMIFLTVVSSSLCIYFNPSFKKGFVKKYSDCQHWLWWHISSLSVVCIAVAFGVFYPLLFALFGFDQVSVTGHYYGVAVEPLLAFVMFLMIYFNHRFNMRMLVFQLVITSFLYYIIAYYFLSFSHQSLASLPFFASLLMLLLLFGLIDNILRYITSGFNFGSFVHALLYLLGFCMLMNHTFSLDRLWHFQSSSENRDALFHTSLVPGDIQNRANHHAKTFSLSVRFNDNDTFFHPEIRHFPQRDMNKPVTDIQHYLFYDMMVVVSEIDHDQFVVRLYVKPLQSVFWIVGVMLAFLALAHALRIPVDRE